FAQRHGLKIGTISDLIAYRRRHDNLVRETAARGATVFMSSHVLREVESVADRVAVIRQGRTVDVDSVRNLRERAGQRVALAFAEAPDPAPFAALPNVREVAVDGTTLRCRLHGEPDALIKLAARHHVTHWSARGLDLEDLFMDLYRRDANGDAAAATKGVRDAR
ncbi:MAG: hypothetical protein P1P87_11750, partial [Trueperaceae bacterium]|nr:hypothetical protein [Trueperaceae bacterium]